MLQGRGKSITLLCLYSAVVSAASPLDAVSEVCEQACKVYLGLFNAAEPPDSICACSSSKDEEKEEKGAAVVRVRHG